MSTTRLTFLYPHLFRSIRVSESAATKTRLRPRAPPRQCLNSRSRGFATTHKRRERLIQRHGKAIEPFLAEGELEEDTKVFTPEDASEKNINELNKSSEETERKPTEKTNNPSSAAPLSEETQAAMRIPGGEGNEPVAGEVSSANSDEPTPRQQAAANTTDPLAPLETVLQMPPPVTIEEENAAKPPHLQAPPYVHHFDTYTLVQQVEAGGFSLDQSITAMKAVRGLLALNLDVAKAGLVSKSDVENVSFPFG